MVIVIAQCYRAARFERHWVMRFGSPWCLSPPEALCVPGRPETGPTGGRTVTVWRRANTDLPAPCLYITNGTEHSINVSVFQIKDPSPKMSTEVLTNL